MKNIAVLIRNIFGDYSAEALRGIIDFYKDKGVNVVVFQTRTANDTAGMCEEQYWINAHLAASKEIDGVIIISAEYVSATPPDELAEELSHLSQKPVISMAIKLPVSSDCSYTYTSCEETYFEIVSHLKNVHGCEKIAFISAGLTKSIEGEERLDAFIKAMKHNHLPLGQIIMSDFTFQHTVRELKKLYRSKEDIDFDALVCANDRMALAAMEVFKEIGVKVPKDVKVIGFDNSESARSYTPALASVDQDVVEFVLNVFETALFGKVCQIVADLFCIVRAVRNLAYFLEIIEYFLRLKIACYTHLIDLLSLKWFDLSIVLCRAENSR